MREQKVCPLNYALMKQCVLNEQIVIIYGNVRNQNVTLAWMVTQSLVSETAYKLSLPESHQRKDLLITT